MRRIESIEAEMRDIAVYEVAGGRMVYLDLMAVRQFGAECLIRDMGIDPGDVGKRLPVFQNGEEVGSLPANFDPASARSKSFFYDFRRGDFVRQDDRWVACWSICPGDFDAVPGFKRNKPAKPSVPPETGA